MVLLGLGSNLGNRSAFLSRAIYHLGFAPGAPVRVLAQSSVFESKALLPSSYEQDWNRAYLNLVLAVDTNLSPEELLLRLKQIEQRLGRRDRRHWAPREIDIDILAFDQIIVDEPSVKIPHPGFLSRNFVLTPAAEIAPDWVHPIVHRTLKDILRDFQNEDIQLITSKFLRSTPELVGILNVTPDSFSDGGNFFSLENAIQRFDTLLDQGADRVDIGAESTRPGAIPISSEVEWGRLFPVLSEIKSKAKNANIQISIDTYHPQTAEKALESGVVGCINDVSGFQDTKMIDVVKDGDCDLVFMHNLGVPANPSLVVKGDVVAAVFHWAQRKIYELEEQGISKKRLVFDPGIGFGKSADQSLELLKHIERFHELGVRILVGHSRKSFLSKFTSKPFKDRDLETVLISEQLAVRGVDWLRVHDIEKQRLGFEISSIFSE
ncbi:MAG: dihydropteroate synthase [Bacteriovoracia bacterium]